MKTTKTILSGEHAVSDKHRIALCVQHIEDQNLEISGLRGQVLSLEERVATLEGVKVVEPKRVAAPKAPKTKGVKNETVEAAT